MANPATPTTFALLENQIEDHLNRADVDDEGVSQMLIALFEDEANDEVYHRERRVRSTASLSSQYLALPDDWEYPLTLKITSTTPVYNLTWVSPEDMAAYRQQHGESSGRPRMVSTSDNALDFLPTPGETYTVEMHYWGTIPALSDSNTTNWLLDRHPLLYLYGCLAHGVAYFKEDERTFWRNYVDAKYRSMRRTYNRSYGPTKPRIRAIG